MADSKSKLMTALVAALVLAVSPVWGSDSLSVDEQRDIILNYMRVTGQHPVGTAASEALTDTSRIKCGMSGVTNFILNRDRLDRNLLMALGAQVQTRPDYLPLSTISPSGKFKIHYSVIDTQAVFQPTVDNNHNGVPDFVDQVAAICDSVWNHHINLLGYPAPPSDSFYTSGDGPQFDIYMHNLGPNYFGLTYIDSAQIDGAGTTRATSYMELDNNYQKIEGYANRPLDAVRVTVAHEFFHSIQFGIDYTESEYTGTGPGLYIRQYWMEMSSVWMEDETYPNINDYYSYLPSFFSFPMVSIQRFRPAGDNHPYGAAVYPIYLSQLYGRDIIKAIWLKCGQLGAGPSFLVAADQVIDSASNHTKDWATSFREFALWNFFTGKATNAGRGESAPPGIGYADRLNYPPIPDSVSVQIGQTIVTLPETDVVTTYPHPDSIRPYSYFPVRPEHNGASYIRLENINKLVRYWANKPNLDPQSICVLKYVDSSVHFADSTALPFRYGGLVCPTASGVCTLQNGCSDTTLVKVDSTVAILVYTGTDIGGSDWGLNLIYQYTRESAFAADSFYVDTFSVPSDAAALIFVKHPQQFKSVTMVFTPATSDWNQYVVDTKKNVGYFVDERLDETIGFDTRYQSLPAAVLTPYPNPAVVSAMDGKQMTFRFQMRTDTASYPSPSVIPTITVDLFNAAGERVRTLTSLVDGNIRTGLYQAAWDMKNEAGNDVTGGVYIAVARLYTDAAKTSLIAESKAKVLIVR